MKIKCYFCQQETLNGSITIASSFSLGVCTYCPHQCTTSICTDINTHVIETARIYFNYEEYRWTANFYVSKGSFKIYQMGKNDENIYAAKLLFKLSFLPSYITPQNILQKMPTMITFS